MRYLILLLIPFWLKAQPGLLLSGKATVPGRGSSVGTTPPNVVYEVNGSTLTISWPTEYLGWRLETQANPDTIGFSNNWQTVVGSASVTSTNMTIDPNGPTVFYRLVYP